MPGLSRRSFFQHSAALAAATAALGRSPIRAVEITAMGRGDEQFEAGVAQVDITPDVGVPMWGYSGRERTATGTLDPLFAKALVLKLGDTAIAIVVIDVGRVPMAPSCARIRDAAKSVGVDEVIFSATHTHSGPVMEDLSEPHTQSIETGMIEAVRQAASATRPATFNLATGPIDIAHNRRVIIDGVCYMRWRNAERLPSSPMDPEAGIVRIDGDDGKPLATLVHYACHPVVFGPDNREYSGDWSGEMCRIVQEHTGAPCLFLQGGAGDINPYLDKIPLAEGGLEAMRGTGKDAAQAVLAVLPNAQPVGRGQVRMTYRETPMDVGVRWNLEDPQERENVQRAYGAVFDYYIQRLQAEPVMPLGVLTLNDALALVFVPGEFFVEYQLDLKRHSPLPHSFLCGYANEFWLYFPTVAGSAIGGYGGTGNAFVEIGAGDRFITEATRIIGQSIGAFGPVRDLSPWASQDWTPDLRA